MYVVGTSGSAINLITNTFKVLMSPDFMLYQYHVDFKPDIQSRGLRSRCVKDHKELLGEHRAFDGMILFLPKKLDQRVSARMFLVIISIQSIVTPCICII